MGGIVSGVTNAVGGLLGGIGTNKQLKQQSKYTDKAMGAQREGLQTAQNYLDPYVDAGQDALGQAQGQLSDGFDRAGLLSDFYGGQEYGLMSNAANNAALASAEATGTLGASTTQNRLGSIASQLGQNYLSQMYQQYQDRFSNLMDIAGTGANAGAQLGGFATGTANNLSGLYQTKGNIQGQKAALPWMTAAYMNNSIGNGAAQDLNSAPQAAGSFFGAMI